MICESLLKEHEDVWRAATVHPFLDACADGTIRPEQFNTWLAQDYHFVLEFTRFAGVTLSKAPDKHFQVLLGGLAAIRDELKWFRAKARERGLDFDVGLQETCRIYRRFLRELAGADYSVMAVAFWAIELAYNQAWQLPGPMQPPYDEFADRWGSRQFSLYVGELQRQADEALKEAGEAQEEEAEQAFLQVAELERDFWQMAYQGGQG